MIDTHCHLASCEPPDSELVASARQSGVTKLATVGMDAGSIEAAIEAAAEHEGVSAVVGRHPNKSAGWQDGDIEAIEAAAARPGVVAIGETGLDLYRDYAPREDQLRSFEAHADLAVKLGLPLVIHTRAAEEDTFRVLSERAAGKTAVILHCFSAPGRLDEAVEHGYMCSFAGNVTYPKALELQEAAARVPEELLLVETDSPYLSPQATRGKPNQPANVVATAEHVADLRGVSYGELERTVEANAARVLRW
ncbi:MAG: TatD family hydrolase [Thermoleophilaceae bacterium]|nr:TatD family hydrolase [Thermoleophilaceae bacterium]